MFGDVSRILRYAPASEPKNYRAEPEKLERATAGSTESGFVSRGFANMTDMSGDATEHIQDMHR